MDSHNDPHVAGADAIPLRAGRDPEDGEYPGYAPRSFTDGDMFVELDVDVPMRDGGTCRIDVFRPSSTTTGEQAPVLVAWGPYGKHGPLRFDRWPGVQVDEGVLSQYTAFEAPDPIWWSSRGYAVVNVDPRGTWGTPGTATFLTPREAEDMYDLIEWLGTREWSSGKVGLAGVSYLAMSQWQVAAMRPPHLAAINAWEALSDSYREKCFHGGIPETQFVKQWQEVASFSSSCVEDMPAAQVMHPLDDDYWEAKRPDVSAIDVPAYVLVGWADQACHTRGTLESFAALTTPNRWLEVYPGKKLHRFYRSDYLARQLAFFDAFLMGKDNEVASWPRARLSVRDRAGSATEVTSDQWPPTEVRLQQLHLDATNGTLGTTAPSETAHVEYDSTAPSDGVSFTFQVDRELVVMGGSSLRLWVSSEGTDMDLFVSLEKYDSEGRRVCFDYLSNFEDGSVALGWLRASHRAVDEERSLPNRPWHPHDREEPLEPGRPYAVDIEIWPSGTRFSPGDTLAVRVQGTDINTYPPTMFAAKHDDTRNVGMHRIHCGGEHSSFLTLPVMDAATS